MPDGTAAHAAALELGDADQARWLSLENASRFRWGLGFSYHGHQGPRLSRAP